METNGILVQIVYVNLVVIVVCAGQFRHAVLQRILFFIHVGSLAASAAARILVNVSVLVHHVLGHQLFLVRLLDALVTLKLVLVTVLTVSNYSPHLALAGQYLHHGVLYILNVEHLTLAEKLLTTKSVNTVSIMRCNVINVSRMVDSFQILEYSIFNFRQVEWYKTPIPLSYLNHS